MRCNASAIAWSSRLMVATFGIDALIKEMVAILACLVDIELFRPQLAGGR